MRTSWENLRLLRASDLSSPFELAGRFGLMTTGTLTVAWWSKDPNLLVWILCYVTAQLIYLAVLLRVRQDAARWQYPMAMALNMANASTFAALPIYLWHQGSVTFQVSAICVVWTHAIYNNARHPVPRGIAIWDAVSISAIVLYFATDLSRSLPEGTQRWIPLFVTGIATCYFVVSIFENYRRANRLEYAETQLIARERLDVVDRIVGGIAHDFNNILTAVLGQIGLYWQSDSPDDKDDAITAADAAAERAAQLTRKLQTYAQQTVLQPARHRIDHLLEETLTDLALTEAQFNLSLSTTLTEDPEVTIDAAQTRAVLSDLILNAIEASEDNQPIDVFADIEVLLKPSAPIRNVILAPGAYLIIAITDTGRGIAAEDLERVFEPFYSTKTSPRSSGLGLAMASGFARQAGGALDVASKQGKGTIVTLYLPLSDAKPRRHVFG